MGKRAKQRMAPAEPGDDKPLWALEPELRRDRKSGKPGMEAAIARSGTTTVSSDHAAGSIGAAVEEAVDADVRSRLAALKAQLEAENAAAGPGATTSGVQVRGGKSPAASRGATSAGPERRSGVRSVDAAEEESFAELFEPRDDEASFEELLNQANLDWKAFK